MVVWIDDILAVIGETNRCSACLPNNLCLYTATVYYDISIRYDYYICKDDTETLCVSNYDLQSNRHDRTIR